MGLNLSPLMFIVFTGLAGVACGYYAFRSTVKKESWMRSGFWFMFCLGGLTGALGEYFRVYSENIALAKILDETFTVTVILGLLIWVMDWFSRNVSWIKKFW